MALLGAVREIAPDFCLDLVVLDGCGLDSHAVSFFPSFSFFLFLFLLTFLLGQLHRAITPNPSCSRIEPKSQRYPISWTYKNFTRA